MEGWRLTLRLSGSTQPILRTGPLGLRLFFFLPFRSLLSKALGEVSKAKGEPILGSWVWKKRRFCVNSALPSPEPTHPVSMATGFRQPPSISPSLAPAEATVACHLACPTQVSFGEGRHLLG